MSRWSSLTTRGNSESFASSRPTPWPLETLPGAIVVCALLCGPWVPPVSGASGREGSAEVPTTFQVAEQPAVHPIVGERLSFHGRWFGIPVGYGWIEVKGVVELEGRKAYHIEAQGHTNEVLSALYPIHDVIHSYLDVETLKPLRFEKDQREGHYRAREVVTFDDQRHVATYRSLLNKSVKEIALPETFQDLISAMYWFRTQALSPSRTLQLNLYTDEKIYQTQIEIHPPAILELLKRGTFSCVRVEPKARFRGLLVRRGRLWAFMTLDHYRLPLLVQATTPWGSMSAVLDETSIPESIQHADVRGSPARP